MFRNENKPRHWTRQNAANSPLSLAIGHSTISPVLFVGVNIFLESPRWKILLQNVDFYSIIRQDMSLRVQKNIFPEVLFCEFD